MQHKHFYASNFFVMLYFSTFLRRLRSDEANSSVYSNISDDQILPIALLRHLNSSTAEILIQEANNMFVSNTSLEDLLRDNDTYQIHLRNRERKRQVRIMTIQREILQKLGFDQEPNMTSRISQEQRQLLLRTYDRRLNEMNDTNEDATDVPCTNTIDDPC